MKKISILLLGAGGNVGMGIIKALRQSSLEYRLVCACVNSNALGLYIADSAYISPYADSEVFIEWLCKVCKEEQIDIILTGVEEIIDVISKNREKLSKNLPNVFIDYQNDSNLDIANDKYKTCSWLKENNCNYPFYAKSNDKEEINTLLLNTSFPLIAKPRRGKGSSGVFMINNKEEIAKLSNITDYVIQEHIGTEDEEYTIGCYCDQKGNFIDCIILHRVLEHGTTVKATVVDNDEIKMEVNRICNNLKATGPVNIQLRLGCNGKPVCFEINLRFSGTTPIRARFGFNDVEAFIRECVLKEDINKQFCITYGTVYRYWDEFYIDENIKHELEQNEKSLRINNKGSFTDGFRKD